MSTSAPVPEIPLYFRTWELTVTSIDGTQAFTISSSSLEPNALRVVFEINMSLKCLWDAEICIYNINPQLLGSVDTNTTGGIGPGSIVSLAAGYRSDGAHPAEIWRGSVFQPLVEREGVTDFKLTLRCINGLEFLNQNLINLPVGPLTSQWDIVMRTANGANSPIPVEHVDDQSAFSQQTNPRGMTLFGSPSRVFDSIASQNNMIWFFGANGLNMGKPERDTSEPDFTFGPALAPGQSPDPSSGNITRSLIGTPQQTQWGVNFTVLLDSRLKLSLPPVQVKLDHSYIRQNPINIGTISSTLTQNGVYIVAGVRHVGDSRGNQWYTEVTALTSVNGKLAMLGGSSSSLF